MEKETKTFEEWYSIYLYSVLGSGIEKVSLQKMLEVVESANQWAEYVLSERKSPSSLWKRINANLYLKRNNLFSDIWSNDLDLEYGNFWEWYEVWIFTEDKETRDYAFAQVFGYAVGFWEWEKIYYTHLLDNKNRDIAIAKMRETAKTDEERKRIALILENET